VRLRESETERRERERARTRERASERASERSRVRERAREISRERQGPPHLPIAQSEGVEKSQKAQKVLKIDFDTGTKQAD